MNVVSRFNAHLSAFLLFTLAYCLLFFGSSYAATLVGWAEMPMHTHVEGPTTNQFNSANFATKNKQIVQGFSGGLLSTKAHTFYFLADNGFGYKKNSADALLRLYEAEVSFSTQDDRNNEVSIKRYLNLKDSNKKLSFNIQADYEHYYDDENKPMVARSIKAERLLTGADIDPESMQIDKNGHLWIGDEFGPFLLEVNALGEVQQDVIPLPEVASPDNPYLQGEANLSSSAGFEAMAINEQRTMLYPLLENSVKGDEHKSLRMYQFDIETKLYKAGYFLYKMENAATNVSDMVAINDTQFLVLERNAAVKPYDEPFKKVYLIDIENVEQGEYVNKLELVDLMRLKDPSDLNADGNKAYAFAYSHVETLTLIDAKTLLIVNDNNYAGRTYFIKVALDEQLPLHVNKAPSIDSPNWQVSRQSTSWINFDDHSFFGWITVLAYFLVSIRSGIRTKIAQLNQQDVLFWVLLTLFLVFLGLNKQLDLQSYFTDVMRDVAKSRGWYDQRRQLQVLFIAALGLFVPVMFLLLRVTLVDLWHRYKVILIGLILLMVFIVIRAASFHHVDLLFYQNIGAIRFYQLLELLAIAVIFAGTFVKQGKSRMTPSASVPGNTNADSYFNNQKDVLEVSEEGVDVACPNCGRLAMSKAVDGRMFKCKSCKHKYRVFVSNQSFN